MDRSPGSCRVIDFKDYIVQTDSLRAALPDRAVISTGQVEGLHYRLFRQREEPEDVVVIYHGGGVSGDAGYDVIARQLCAEGPVAACVVDIRGHGFSTGERGTVARPDRIWQDVDLLLAEMRRLFPNARRHLLGHSSGAGMLLNSLTRFPFTERADSLILLAPELGPFSATARKTSAPFARVRQWPFVVNALSGGRLMGQSQGVSLLFPAAVPEPPAGLVRHYSVNMANALTPRHPGKQLAALPIATLILAAEEDEIICCRALGELVARSGNARLAFQTIDRASHLGCVFVAYRFIHDFVTGCKARR
nr:alpha/beta hydrolase [Pantoea coffeiphila]